MLYFTPFLRKSPLAKRIVGATFFLFFQIFFKFSYDALDARGITPGYGRISKLFNGLPAAPETPKVTTGVHFFDHWVQSDHGGFIPSDHWVQIPFGEGSKVNTPLPTGSDFQTGQKANKGFQQQPMCRNPVFSAVFPIFCSFPLYQISGLHFYVNAVFDTIRFCLCTF